MQRPQLLVYAEPVRIASIETAALCLYLHKLLPCLLGGSSTRFFSLTRTDPEVSIIFDTTIDLEDDDHCVVEPQKWRVLTLADGTGPSQLIDKLTRPLARAGISIFFSSTYQTDLLLVREGNFKQALAVLSAHFDIIDANTDEEIPLDVEPGMSVSTDSIEFADSEETRRPIVFLESLRLRVAHCSQGTEEYVFSLATLLRLVFYRSEPFLFLALVDSSLTLVIPDNSFQELFQDAGLKYDSAVWVPARVAYSTDGLGFEETGIVTFYARPLVQKSLPVYYISTYLTDYIMVESTDVHKAKQCWTNSGVDVNDGASKISETFHISL